MHRTAIQGLCFLFGIAAVSSAVGETPTGRLVWENGDVLSGSVIGAKDGKLEWLSPVFAGPFSLEIDQLKSIHFAAAGDHLNSSEPLRFATQSGDVLHGRLVEVTGDHVAIESERHGRVSILRTALRGFGRIDPRALEDSGPPNTDGWRALSTTQTISQWKTDAAGRMSTQILDAELGGDFQLPEVAEFDLALSWKNRPQFVITFGSVRAMRFGGEVAKIEATDDRLILREAGQARSQLLATNSEASKRVRLKVLWDRAREELAVYTSSGDLLGKTKITAAAGTGLHIKNKGRDLTVDYLRMRPSAGAVRPEPAAGEANIRLFDGTVFSGRLVGLERAGGAILVEDPQAGRRRVPTDSLVSVHFTNVAPDPAGPMQLKVRYYDGTLVSGTLLAAGQEMLKLQTSFSREAVPSTLAGVREIVFLSERRVPPPSDLDLLEIGGEEGGMLHGRLVAVDAAGGALGWQPVGSEAASPLAGTHAVRFIRRSKKAEPHEAQPDPQPNRVAAAQNPFAARASVPPDEVAVAKDANRPASDVLYLQNGDMLLCRVEALDNEQATITSDLFDTKTIPTASIKAVEFNSESFVPFAGFHGEQWVVTEREEDVVTVTDDSVTFRGQATLGHNGLLQGDELQFDVLWNPESRCVLTINLYSNDARQSTGIPLMLYFMEQNLLVRGPNARGFIQHAPAQLREMQVEQQRRQLLELRAVQIRLAEQLPRLPAERQQHVREQLQRIMEQQQKLRALPGLADVAEAGGEQPAEAPDDLRRATIRFEHKGKSLEINIDNSQSFSQPIAERDDLAGKGILFSVQPVAVRRVRIVDAQGRIQQIAPEPEETDLLKITNLVVSRSGNAMRFLRIEQQQMQSVLTIPRSRKNNPPTHMLVAQNGDLLRGELVRATENQVEFRSRLDTLTFDRSRVAAIVSLGHAQQQEVADTVDPAAPPADEADAAAEGMVRVALSDGTRLTFTTQESLAETFTGEHPLLGECRIDVDHVHELQAGGQVRPWPVEVAYDEWRLTSAKEPIFPEGSGAGFGADSPLVGTPAEDFTAELLDGGPFRLADHQDKVVVLDFWATWCGPCAEAMPRIVEAVSQFPPDQVVLVAVNQQEPEAAIRGYLAARDWDFTVALDRDGRIGRQFQVEALPQTVVIGKGGQIERLHIGSHPNVGQELHAVIEELLTPTAEVSAGEQEGN